VRSRRRLRRREVESRWTIVISHGADCATVRNAKSARRAAGTPNMLRTMSHDEAQELRERVAFTLANRGREAIDRVLDHFGFNTVDPESELREARDNEAYVLDVLLQDPDEHRQLAVDAFLHLGNPDNVLEVGPDGYQRSADPDSSFLVALAEEVHPEMFAETHRRLRAVRLFLATMERVVRTEAGDNPITPKQVYSETRRQTHPHFRAEPVDLAALMRQEMASTEFPLIAWAPSLAYCFSTLERFLADIAALAAKHSGATAPTSVSNPKIESWLATIRSFGVSIVIPPQTLNELRTLRPIRNTLTHRLTLSLTDIPAALHPEFDVRSNDVVPTASLVRRALRAVDDVVNATETAFTIESLDRSRQLYGE
jgi:hypothetical protein